MGWTDVFGEDEELAWGYDGERLFSIGCCDGRECVLFRFLLTFSEIMSRCIICSICAFDYA